MEIRMASKADLKEVTRLCANFAKEGCCNNIVADNEEYFEGKIVWVGEKEHQIVAYAYGNIEKEENKRSYAKPGDSFFELEEIYVSPQYRDEGVGQRLFREIEAFAKHNGAKTLRLNAVSKDYKSLLKFYIDMLGMEFISAYLVKKL